MTYVGGLFCVGYVCTAAFSPSARTTKFRRTENLHRRCDVVPFLDSFMFFARLNLEDCSSRLIFSTDILQEICSSIKD